LHVTRIGGFTNWNKFFELKILKRKRPVGGPKCRWEDTIKMDLKETVWKGVEWILLAQDSNQWRWTLVNMVTNLQAQYKAANFVTSWTTINFSRRTLFLKAEPIQVSVYFPFVVKCSKACKPITNLHCLWQGFNLQTNWPTSVSRCTRSFGTGSTETIYLLEELAGWRASLQLHFSTCCTFGMSGWEISLWKGRVSTASRTWVSGAIH